MLMLSIGSAVLYAVAIVMLACLHGQDRGVHWASDPVSNHALGAWRGVFNMYGYIGTAGALLLLAQFASDRSTQLPAVVPIAMVVLVVSRVLVLWVPTDQPGESTRSGKLHLVFAIASFAAAYTAIANATAALAHGAPAWLAAGLASVRWLAMVSLTGVVVTMLPKLKRAFGAFERAFLFSTMLWFLLASVRMGIAARIA
ncbi:DUF998 domain-containing protein [Pseudorhodoferax sp.]|uniref:DUF998 domain-containing protein n=1 Tax=Pseudorhodoferax sp. TaxID=1993553 RepID=UPI0039E40814